MELPSTSSTKDVKENKMIRIKILVYIVFLTYNCTAANKEETFDLEGKHGFEHLGKLTKESPGHLDEKNYFISDTAALWDTAEKDCRDIYGPTGRLVSIETKEESDMLNAWMDEQNHEGGAIWTSGKFETHDPTWTWAATGDMVAFNAWNEGQPGPCPDEGQRIALRHLNRFSAGWVAVEGDELRRYICELKKA